MILPNEELNEESDVESEEESDVESNRELDLEGFPKLYQHCVRLYELLYKYGEDVSGGEIIKIYEGSITPLITELGISQSYQSKLVGRLRVMRCITMLKRGSGAAKSKWGLYKHPTIEDFHESDSTGEVKWRKELDKFDAQAQRITDLGRRITLVENWLRDQGAPL
jgi:hypothetical protein